MSGQSLLEPRPHAAAERTQTLSAPFVVSTTDPLQGCARVLTQLMQTCVCSTLCAAVRGERTTTVRCDLCW